MIISLEDVSKKYDRTWIFKSISLKLIAGNIYAVIGKNGSGKSTFLKVISGIQSPSTGKVIWRNDNVEVKKEFWYRHLTFCAPAMEIIEEFTLLEYLEFHFKFKSFQNGISIDYIIDILEMDYCKNQKISEYSSGMKQRVKLAQAFFSESDLLILDEPTSNLDEYWIAKYQEWLSKYVNNRIVIIASNDTREYISANHQIVINDYKQ